ncbi:MAG: Glycosyl transferase group 1 [Candidatus Falkowbacteria bacterium GW2011_GWF2_39_8]|uniref:Glycosyl transferase group 1 n=1 Tax=Candidatus Falkowbacteria bacterium GW2011_GWF2_39_8 TaxID=1618642 RepID=A0A0G0SD86_9BACT|nr:MAG: Glycosyl transferase group 1 [Candidatus Falkowbacteria bacterium GW2011_GWF2_39_8]
MKIGIDIRTLMDAHYSGVSEFTFNLLTNLFAIDKENQYKIYYNSGKDISAHLPKFNQPNVKLIYTSYPNKIFNYLFLKIFKYPKIDQLLDVDLFFMPHIGFIALSGKTRNIITIHDLSFLRYPKVFSLRKNFWHKMVNAKKLVNEFDEVVAVSHHTKKDLVEICKVKPEKIKVIHLGIGEDLKVKEKDDERLNQIKTKYSLPDKFILFLGTVEPRKNIEGVMRAFELYRKENSGTEIKLVIAGARGWKSESIYKLWERSEYKNDIYFIGYVDRKDKVYLYNLASIFVYPSFYEGFGFPPLEAMACGLPTITSYNSSLAEVVADAAILVDPFNIQEISTAMSQLLSNQLLYNKYKDGGLIRAKDFTWQKTAEGYLGLFNGK